jgi:hypothetical protein
MATTPVTKMKISGRSASALGLLCAAVLLSACGITAPRQSEGYANLESLGVLDTNRTMNFSFGPTLLRFAVRHIDDEPELVDMLRSLEGVRIRIYEIDGDTAKVAARIESMSAHLREDGWEPVALIREENEQTHMLLRIKGERIRGLTVLVSDGVSEAVVVNLMGEIEPRHFSDLMVAMEVDVPGVQNVQVADSRFN